MAIYGWTLPYELGFYQDRRKGWREPCRPMAYAGNPKKGGIADAGESVILLADLFQYSEVKFCRQRR